MMSTTSAPATVRASVISRRWQRHGTASLHMITGRPCSASSSSSFRPSLNSSLSERVGGQGPNKASPRADFPRASFTQPPAADDARGGKRAHSLRPCGGSGDQSGLDCGGACTAEQYALSFTTSCLASLMSLWDACWRAKPREAK
jgi:hypothetical protein